MGLGINEERDAENLRFLFVCEVTENIDEYREWTTSDSLAKEIELFKNDRHFASELGDICAKACANLLRIPIVLITALPELSLPFRSYQNISLLLHLFTWRTTIQVQGIMTGREVCSDNSHMLNPVEQRNREQVF